MRIAIVVPRYGPEIVGGAEVQARGFAEEAARQQWTVEVWTTCARNHYTWENELAAGASWQNGVRVCRFPVVRRHIDRQAALDIRLDTQGTLARDDQYAWLECGAHSPALYQHVAAHAAGFDAVIVLPYSMQLAHYAAWAAPERVVLFPCLHVEPYAYLEPVRLLLENVRGVMFNTPEERDLALRQLRIEPRRHTVLGEGVDLAAVPAPPVDPATDLLYMGRLESGKNLPLLYRYVRRYVDEGGDLRLRVVGRGPLQPPKHRAFVFHGFVSDAEKAAACASALALCQPSLRESFSLTIMESWLAGRPVLVHEGCAVTRGHVARSKGGLWFRTYEEFAGCIEWLLANPDRAQRMGENGRSYVTQNYTWESVIRRFQRIVREWQKGS